MHFHQALRTGWSSYGIRLRVTGRPIGFKPRSLPPGRAAAAGRAASGRHGSHPSRLVLGESEFRVRVAESARAVRGALGLLSSESGPARAAEIFSGT